MYIYLILSSYGILDRMFRLQDETRDELCDWCIQRVLSHVDAKADKQAACLVSRRWRQLQLSLRTSLHFCYEEYSGSTGNEELEKRVQQALQTWPHLTSLSIQHQRTSYKGPDVSFLGRYPAIMSALNKLTVLRLIRCQGVDDALMARLNDATARRWAALAHLSLRHCVAHRLQFPDTGISDAGLLAIAAACPHLISLDLTHHSAITDSGLDALLGRHCKLLQELRVTSCRRNVCGWGFRHGRCLTRLTCKGCEITDAGLQEGLRSAGSSLRYLNLRRHPAGEEYRGGTFSPPSKKASFEAIARLCPLLEELSLKRAGWLAEDNMMAAIARGCPRLRVLDASRCFGVGVSGWQALAVAAGELQELDVTYCSQFDEESLQALGRGCPQLRILKLLRDSRIISKEGLQFFREARPAVQILEVERRRWLGRRIMP